MQESLASLPAGFIPRQDLNAPPCHPPGHLNAQHPHLAKKSSVPTLSTRNRQSQESPETRQHSFYFNHKSSSFGRRDVSSDFPD